MRTFGSQPWVGGGRLVVLLAKYCFLLGEAVHPAQAVVCRPCVYTAGMANGIKVM